LLHVKCIALNIQQFNMLIMENGKENPVTKMLMQMLSIGAEMENSQRKIRQCVGIQPAKIKGIYKGRINGQGLLHQECWINTRIPQSLWTRAICQ
jgi:DNA invertase Pin-like site-specific DNA recombinase